ncbi:MAG: proteasome subunit beta [Halobacterium sp.]
MPSHDQQSRPATPDRPDSRAPFHETSPAVGEIQQPGDGAQVAETGTTIVGLTASDAVVLAADQRASVGGGRFVTNKSTRKVERVHPTAAVALSGAVGHNQHFARVLRAETRLYDDRRGDPPSMTALSTLAANALRSAPLRVTPLLGGVDADGPHVYSVDAGGGVLADDYAAGGSGMQLAYGVLERQYDDSLSVDDARGVATRAVDSASERDTASGNGFTVATVTEDGVDVEDFDALAEVA